MDHDYAKMATLRNQDLKKVTGECSIPDLGKLATNPPSSPMNVDVLAEGCGAER